MDSVLLLVLVGIWASCLAVVTESTTKDYCLDEKFSASCGGSDIIMIDSAIYGRMDFGTCVQRDYGYLGCKVDVTDVLADKCSGRQTCEVVNLEALFAEFNPCQPDLKSYLRASSSCQMVTPPLDPDMDCEKGYMEPLPPSPGTTGLLASVEQRWGTVTCPWRIHTLPGQQVNLTLHDYSDHGMLGKQNPAFCKQYMIVSEENIEKKVVGCSHEKRPRNIYLSSSNDVFISITVSPSNDAGINFLLEFSVVGCPRPVLPDNTYYVDHRDGTIIVNCNFTSESWTLKCKNNTWDGSLGNCSARVAAAAENLIPLGVAIIIIVGVALLVCTGVLLVGFLVIYCKRRSSHKRLVEEQRYHAIYNKTLNNASIVNPRPVNNRTKHASLEKSRAAYSPLTKSRTLRSQTTAGEYTHIWEVKHPIPVATPEVPKVHVSVRRETLTMTASRSSPTMASARSPMLERRREARPCEIPRIPTFSTFKPDGELHESPRFKGQNSQCSSHSSQSSPLYFEIDTKRKAQNHYST